MIKNLKGSEKQIKWAEEIKENLIEQVNEKSVPEIYFLFTKTENGIKFIDELKRVREDNPNYFSNDNLSNQYVISKIRQLIENETDSKTFLENQSLISFLRNILK